MSTSRLKSAALFGAAAFGLTAFGGDYIWSGGTSGSWTGENVWSQNEATTENYVFGESADDVEVSVASAVDASTKELWVENGSASTVKINGTNAQDATEETEAVPATGLSFGRIYVGSGTRAGSLYLNGGVYNSYDDLSIAFNLGQSGALTLENATLTCQAANGSAKWIIFGAWGQELDNEYSGSITLKAGSKLNTHHIQSYLGGDATINLAGGTLAFLGDSTLGNYWQSGENSVYGADGTTAQPKEQNVSVTAESTIDVADHTVTVTAPVAGSAKLVKQGSGTLAFTSASLNGFTGAYYNVSGTTTISGCTVNMAEDLTGGYYGDSIIAITNGTVNVGANGEERWVIADAWNSVAGIDSTIRLDNGGTLGAWHIQRGSTNGSSKVVFNGGTLRALGSSWTGNLIGVRQEDTALTPTAVEVASAGGTIDTDFNVTIASALTGSGTLTKTGAGELTLSGDVSNFKGKIVVDEDAGYVTIGNETIYPGETKDFDPQATYTVWSEDFEGTTALQGWTCTGNGSASTIRTRTLADGSSSQYYCYTAQKSGGSSARSVTATYALNLADADIYAFEFDVYPKVAWNNDNTLTVTGVKSVLPEVEGGEESVTPVTLATFVAKYPGNSNPGTFQITAGNVTGSVSMDGRGDDNTTADMSTRWYRVVISGDKAADKTYLQVLNRDGTVAVERSEIGEFAKVSELSVNLKTSRNGPTVFGFDNFVFKTVAPEGIPADPVVAVTPDSYAGDRTVTITCENDDATIYWRNASGEFAEYTEPITVAESTTIYAYAQNAIGKSETTVAVMVYANVKLSAPTVVRRGWYRLQITAGDAPIAGEEPQYVFSYVMNGCGTTPKTTETGDSALVRASSGAGFNVNGTWARVFATADGFKNSDTVNYAGYTFDPTKFNVLYNMDWIDESNTNPRSSVWPDETLIEVDGVNYRSFGTGAKSYANDYFFVSSDNDSGGSSRWDIYRSNKSSNGLRYNGATTVGNGRVLFKDVKPGTLIYLNSDELTDPVNMTLVSEGYTNADEYVYEVTGEGETVNATIKIGVNYGRIYCVKIYEPIPEETDTFAADEATLVDGAFTVPEGTTKITLGGKDVTNGFNIEGTTATLLSPWFARNGEEFGEGMVVGEETVRLDIDLVEGLYYGPAAATTLEGLARPATLTMYDGTNAAALTTVAKPEGGTAFFTVFVDVKAE